MDDDDIKKRLLEAMEEDEKTFGLNHWETVLKKACINDPDAYDFLATH